MVFLAQRSKSLPPSSQYDTVRSDAAITEYKIEAQNWGVLATGRLLRQCGVIELGHAKKKKSPRLEEKEQGKEFSIRLNQRLMLSIEEFRGISYKPCLQKRHLRKIC
jgi:hypothetical protein